MEKDLTINVRMSMEEKASLKLNAERLDMTVSDFVRLRCLGDTAAKTLMELQAWTGTLLAVRHEQVANAKALKEAKELVVGSPEAVEAIKAATDAFALINAQVITLQKKLKRVKR